MKRLASFARRLALVLPIVLGCGEAQLDDALEDGDVTTAKLILTGRSGLVHATDEDGRTRLHTAAQRNQAPAVSLLLDRSADIDAADRYRYTALHYAAQRGYEESVRVLADNGADPGVKNHCGYTPLHCAAERGHDAVVKTLLETGADPFTLDDNGRAAAQVAYEEGHYRTYRLLLPIHDAAGSGDISRLRFLLESRPDLLDARDRAGRTPLHAATRRGQTEAIDWLVARGADATIEDIYGYTASYYSVEAVGRRTGVNSIAPAVEVEFDRVGHDALSRYDYVKVAAVLEGEVVFSRCYGDGRLADDDVWGSVSKPVTAMIVMHLVSTGAIDSIDDPIWKYSPRYENCMPAPYAGDPLTIRHLLIHNSGVPHNNEPTWKDGKLNLKFKPGTGNQYSTPGYGILGHIIEDVTGLSYSDAVGAYIGEPVGASSYHAEVRFRAPGAGVRSTVDDMALFAIGVMDHAYVPTELFYGEMVQLHSGPAGIGWGVVYKDSPDLKVFHGGSNGRPQAYLEIKPRKRLSVCLLARAKDPNSFELNAVSNQLLSILEEQ